ncbi:MAG TPA: MMPL family transporter [Streptosporangiaceae bacterium]|nr:MMPL family transporter [Streptosporangiaceae bacterium]
MFEGWGRVIYRRRWLTLVIAGVGIVIAAAWGTRVFGALTSGNSFTPPDSQSQREADAAASAFGRNAADAVVLYRSARLTVSDPGYRTAVTGALASLPRSEVPSVTTYWTAGPAAGARLVSADRHETYAVLQLAGADDAARQKTYRAIKADFTPPGLAAHGVTAQVGGTVPTEVAINGEVTANIGKAEGFSMPVLLILLLIIFGSLAAASLPLAVGVTAILGSFTVLRLLTLFTTVSIYSVNITTIIGLGLGIDYGLFMVVRFREELRRQPTTEAAVARTVATAGRTIAVSGVTVAVALTSLMLFPEVFLRSMGYGGVATVAVDMVAALTVLPALLSVMGTRVNALRVRRSLRPAGTAGSASLAAAGEGDEHAGAWYRLAHGVMRRPVAFVVVITIALLALGAPFLRISWGGTDARALPAAAQPRQVTEALNRDFPANSTSPIEVVVTLPGPAGSPAGHAALAAYTGRLDRVPGVTGAEITAVRGNSARVDIGYQPSPVSTAARQIVQGVRGVAAPAGATVLVGGTTAQLVDELASLGSTLPWMALMVVLSTFVLLFLAFGSVVLPVKAIVMNVLSLSATFGVIVWIFQWGHLSRLLQFTPTGTIDPTMPILMLAIIFGLSMDYEVFLLSRVRELYDQTGDNRASVAGGLQRTGGVITSLALLLVIVVGLFSASGITFIKLTGVGMIIALVIDASIVRVLLVPATMRLLGRANWWAPGPLRRLYARYGIREEDRQPAPVAVTAKT